MEMTCHPVDCTDQSEANMPFLDVHAKPAVVEDLRLITRERNPSTNTVDQTHVPSQSCNGPNLRHGTPRTRIILIAALFRASCNALMEARGALVVRPKQHKRRRSTTAVFSRFKVMRLRQNVQSQFPKK